ncbi:MAG TPA: DHHA1 domain-containing protein [Vicinamibacterales bacterium]|jgi:alanyl-tRNA synthetase|nr:DHHA1 domain-containing protein [Vicinamibacterales bacterium]
MADRIYYADPYARQFEATVVSLSSKDGRPVAVLDRTAFYPTSGGQPFDTGTINGVRVTQVEEDDAGEILHVLDRAVEPGPVHGEIDWDRRFDHMQQHTGQHVLSAAFDRVCGAPTVSFHLGAERSTIDLSREPRPDEVAAAEREANRVVWEDRPVSIRFAPAEEVASMALRKQSRRGGELRLIEVDGFDLSACGGTHVLRTGAIGIIAVSGWERFKGGLRVEFVCGGRALTVFRSLREIVSAGARALTVHPAELPASIERLQSDSKEHARTLKRLQERLAAHEADALARSAQQIGDHRVVVASLEGWDAGGLKALASTIVARPGHAAVLIAPSASGSPLVVARAADVALDAAALLRAIVARFGGKGGGKADLAQGGGLSASQEALAQMVREELTRS